jgi:uncharacterized Zn finger protein
MGWSYDFRPYVSAAQRRQRAAQEMKKRRAKGQRVLPVVIEGRTIARTFWGQAWCANLEGYSDFENRLPRGRTYVRNGSVVHLEIQQGKISALVSGSELYKVEIRISALPAERWTSIKNECGGQIGSLVELLQGRLSKHVMDVVTRRDGGLFPKPAEIQMSCSCPDWAGMCKHVAATMYGVGRRLDDQPDLLFLLRKVDHLELIESAVTASSTTTTRAPSKKKTIAASDLADVFGIELTEPDTSLEEANSVAPRSRSRPSRKRAPSLASTPSDASKKPPSVSPAPPTSMSKQPRSTSIAGSASASTVIRKAMQPRPVTSKKPVGGGSARPRSRKAAKRATSAQAKTNGS